MGISDQHPARPKMSSTSNAHRPNVSVTEGTELLGDLSSTPRRQVSRLTFLYKMLNEHVAVPPDKIDLVLCQRPVYGPSTKHTLAIPHSQ